MSNQEPKTIEEFLREYEEIETKKFEDRVMKTIELLEKLPFKEAQVLLTAFSVIANRMSKMYK